VKTLTLKEAYAAMESPHEINAVIQHAVAVLPEVVAALSAMIDEKVLGPFFHEDENDDPRCALQLALRALTKANKVQIP